MIKKEMIYRNTCNNCGYSWTSIIGQEVVNICTACGVVSGSGKETFYNNEIKDLLFRAEDNLTDEEIDEEFKKFITLFKVYSMTKK